MKKAILLFVAVIGLSINTNAQTTWTADTGHSGVNFSIKHMGISFVDGRMDKFQGTVVMNDDDITSAKFNFTVDANSINTGIESRDNHLKAADIFDTKTYETIKFVSTSVKKVSKDKYQLIGNLTLKDVTKPVTFDLTYGGKATNNGKEKIGFQATTTIDRTAFNINYDPTGAGIAKDVMLRVNLELAK